MTRRPSPNGLTSHDVAPGRDGRDQRGRFAPGNTGGPGNPHAAQVSKLRAALLESVTDDDLRGVMSALVKAAKGGSVPAARELLERVLGKPVELDIIERLDALERRALGEGCP